MIVLSTWVFLGIWLVTVVFYGYITRRLYEGKHPSTESLLGIQRKIAYITSCLALGVGVALFTFQWFYEDAHLTERVILAFILAFAAGIIIIILVSEKISVPYRKRQQEENKYIQAMFEAKLSLKKKGLLPKELGPFVTPEEIAKYEEAIEELRSQGKLPPIPQWMKEKK